MVACNLVAGVTVLALVVAMTAGWAELVMLYVVAIVLAACDVTYTLAVQASLPDIIPTDRLGVANGRLIAVEGAGEQFIGPASGGILFSLARRLPFLVDGISFFVSAWLVRTGLPRDAQRHALPVLPGANPATTTVEGAGTAGASSNGAGANGANINGANTNGADSNGAGSYSAGASVAGSNGARSNGAHPNGAFAPNHDDAPNDDETGGDLPRGTADLEEGPLPTSEPRPGWVANFREGLSVFRNDRALKLLATTAASAALCQTMVIAILVLYGKQTLHLTSTGYGLFLAFAAAIGVAAAHFAGYMQQRFGSGHLILGGLVLSIVSYVGLAFTHSVVLAVFVFGLQEVGTVAVNVGSVTARQHLIPRPLYGRVGSVHRLAVLSASVVGALLGGFIASASSVATTMLVAGALLIVATVLVSPLLLRTLARRDALPTQNPQTPSRK
jgi:hypothetical protein